MIHREAETPEVQGLYSYIHMHLTHACTSPEVAEMFSAESDAYTALVREAPSHSVFPCIVSRNPCTSLATRGQQLPLTRVSFVPEATLSVILD